MEHINSKALYLKHYSVRQRTKTQCNNTRSIITPENSKSLYNKIYIHLNHHIAKQQKKQKASVEPLQNIKNDQLPSLPKHSSKLREKEEQALSRVLTFKNKSCQSKSMSRRLATQPIQQTYVFKKKKSWHEFVSMDEESMKPTDKYFHQLNNIRLAERLLLAKPTKDLSKKNLNKFYKEQEVYKFNISRLSFSSNKKSQHHHKRLSTKWRE